MKIKLSVFLFISSFSFFSTYGQNRLDKFCEVRLNFARMRGMNGTTDIDFDKQNSNKIFQDSAIAFKLNKVTEGTTSVSMLNYLYKLGWSLMSTIPLPSNWCIVEISFLFKKHLITFKKISDN